MNVESISGRNLSGAFRIANLVVAGLSVLCGLSQLFSGFQSFVVGLYIIFFGAGIGALEFKVPSETYNYASFLFSFIGRGIFYTLIGTIIKGSSVFRVLSSIVICLIGIGYLFLQTIPGISPPENMNPEGVTVGMNDEDVI